MSEMMTMTEFAGGGGRPVTALLKGFLTVLHQ